MITKKEFVCRVVLKKICHSEGKARKISNNKLLKARLLFSKKSALTNSVSEYEITALSPIHNTCYK